MHTPGMTHTHTHTHAHTCTQPSCLCIASYVYMHKVLGETPATSTTFPLTRGFLTPCNPPVRACVRACVHVCAQSCKFDHNRGIFMKDLRLCEPDLAKVMILDNSPSAYELQPANAIPIVSWFDNPFDTVSVVSVLPYMCCYGYFCSSWRC